MDCWSNGAHLWQRRDCWRTLLVLGMLAGLLLGMPPFAVAQGGCANLLTNGGFEETAEWILPLTPSSAIYSQEERYRGSWSLRTGIPATAPNRRADSLAIRTITLPAADTLTLQMNVWRSANTAESDFHYVWVKSGGQTYRVFQETGNEQAWQAVSFDLTPLAGRRVQLLIGTFNTGWGDRALMYVDEVTISTCPSPVRVEDAGESARQETPQPTPIPTVTPTPALDMTPEEAAPAAEAPADSGVPNTATPVDTLTPEGTATPPDMAATTPPATPGTPAAAARDLTYGVNAYLWSDAASAGRSLDLAARAGFGLVRQRFVWNEIERQADTFEWETADRVVRQANESGLMLLVQLTPDSDDPAFWGVPVPQHRSDFVRFVAAVAARYACTPTAVGCVDAYQIGEEPNRLGIWGNDKEAPEAYVSLLQEAYAAIKASRPEALVISAGMAPVDEDGAGGLGDIQFYQRMYRAMTDAGSEHFDLLGVNAYALTAPPELAAPEVAASSTYGQKRVNAFRHVEDVREVMDLFGDTETGVAVFLGWAARANTPAATEIMSAAPIDEFVKATYLVRALVYAADSWQPWLDMAVVLTLPDPAWFTDGNPFDEDAYWWAIAEPGAADRLRIRPAYLALCHHLLPLRNETCPYPPNSPASAQGN